MAPSTLQTPEGAPTPTRAEIGARAPIYSGYSRLLRRLPRWEEALQARLAVWRRRPYRWDGGDCARFAADAIAAMTGVMIPLPEYQTRRAAWRILQASGGLQAAVSAELGSEQWVPWFLLRRGDLALDRTGHALGIVLGETVMWRMRQETVTGWLDVSLLDADECQGGWHVG